MSDGFFMATSFDAGLRLDELKIRWNAFVDEQPIPSARKRFPALVVILDDNPVESIEQADARIRTTFLNVWKEAGSSEVVKNVAIAVQVIGEVPRSVVDVNATVLDARAVYVHMQEYLSNGAGFDLQPETREQLKKASRSLRDIAERSAKDEYRARKGIKPIFRVGKMAP